jgi:hypothetical protein
VLGAVCGGEGRSEAEQAKSKERGACRVSRSGTTIQRKKGTKERNERKERKKGTKERKERKERKEME